MGLTITHAFLVTLVLLHTSSGDVVTQTHCCNLGIAWSELNQQCDGHPVPIPSVDRHLQAICLSTLSICCLRSYRSRMCVAGIESAKINPHCLAVTKIGGEYYKDCCDACKLGIAVRGRGVDQTACYQDSTFKFGSPWDDAFHQCCIAGLNGTSGSGDSTTNIPAKRNATHTALHPTYNPLHPSPLPVNAAHGSASFSGALTHNNHLYGRLSNANVECDQFPRGQLCDHRCVDGPQGYYCECHSGYRLHADSKSCIPDTSRCTQNNPCDQVCEDTGDTILCSCRTGYELNDDGRTCKDMDECYLQYDTCNLGTERCVNTVGGYDCVNVRDGTVSDSQAGRDVPYNSNAPASRDGCPPGYEYSHRLGNEYNPRLRECQDVDECARGTDSCDHTTQFCTNTVGSHVCVTKRSTAPCPPGYKYNDASSICIDVDECAEGLDACIRQRELCLNQVGTYECHPKTVSTCPAGYKYNNILQSCEDVDECSEILDNCDAELETCRNVAGGYECDLKCDQGYHFVIAFRVCLDVDECLERTHSCDIKSEICFNTDGSYQCLSRPTSQCEAGYKPDRSGCVDVDECMEQLDTCDHELETCVNNVGLYHCVPQSGNTVLASRDCPDGHRVDPDNPLHCTDIDECAEHLHDCYHPTICTNVVGSYICDLARCQVGFQLNLTTGLCHDIDECQERLSKCSRNEEVCVNTDGGYECHPKMVDCPSGHHYGISSKRCEDIDECELHLDSCNHSTEICLNAQGSYRCWEVQCPDGYRPNITARTCEDIDECVERSHNCTREETCINHSGRFMCSPKLTQCPTGQHYNSVSNACQDIDECSEGTHSCDETTQECINTPDKYECIDHKQQCPPGFKMDAIYRACVDIDECIDTTHDCEPETSECRNTHGSFVCRERIAQLTGCSPGFRFDNESQRCLDVDECSKASDTCDRQMETCVNSVGSFTCVSNMLVRCQPGHRFDARTRMCEDIDECLENSHTCRTDTEQCYNYAGGFRCLSTDYAWQRQTEGPHVTDDVVTTSADASTTSSVVDPTSSTTVQTCSAGFEYSNTTQTCMDINECQFGNHTCLTTQRCDNTIGSFTCIRLTGCGTGYTLNAHTSHCEDDDECELGNHNCAPAYECRNTLGSFRCDRKTCPSGYQLLVDGRCAHLSCGAGMQPDASTGQCADINECDLAADTCRSNQRCVNTQGSYECQNLIYCGGGYEMDPYGTRCLDIDECTKGTHDCGGNQQCINRPGGYICQCPVGYSLTAQNECQDVDECSQYYGKACSSNALCRNTPGSFICDCKEGFQHGVNNRTCVDVDECQQFGTVCQHSCINTWGSYQCTCLPGYTQGEDKRTCNDVDECSLYKGRGNLCIGICVNELGSFSCSCPAGYKLGADKRTCQDIDECQQDNVCKGPDETCLNTRGSFKCNTLYCPPDYIRDVNHKNRCKRESTICRQDDNECIKQPLSYSFNYLTFVSNLPIPPAGYVNLFTMRGPPFSDLSSEFSLELKDARTPVGVAAATKEAFQLRRTAFNQAVISLVSSIEGPQEIELELVMTLYRGSQLGGTALAKIFIYVSSYEF